MECIKQRFADEIRWPNAEERKDMHEGFAVHPQAVAAFDGTRLRRFGGSSATEESITLPQTSALAELLDGVDCYGSSCTCPIPSRAGRTIEAICEIVSYIANHLSEFSSKGE